MSCVEDDIAALGRAQTALTATLGGIPLYRRMGYRSEAPVVLQLPGDRLFVGLAMEKTLGGRGCVAVKAAA